MYTLSKHVLLGLRLNKNKITWGIKGFSENFRESNTEECSVTNAVCEREWERSIRKVSTDRLCLCDVILSVSKLAERRETCGWLSKVSNIYFFLANFFFSLSSTLSFRSLELEYVSFLICLKNSLNPTKPLGRNDLMF